MHIVAAFRKKPADELLAQLRSLASESSARVRSHPLQSDPVEAIARVATEEGADLIVVGSRELGGSRRLSDVSRGVMARAECAVLVV